VDTNSRRIRGELGDESCADRGEREEGGESGVYFVWSLSYVCTFRVAVSMVEFKPVKSLDARFGGPIADYDVSPSGALCAPALNSAPFIGYKIRNLFRRIK